MYWLLAFLVKTTQNLFLNRSNKSARESFTGLALVLNLMIMGDEIDYLLGPTLEMCLLLKPRRWDLPNTTTWTQNGDKIVPKEIPG